MIDDKITVLDPIEFHGQYLKLVDVGGEPYVVMKRVVEGMGLAWPPQYTKLRDGADRWGVTMIVTPSEGGAQEAVCLPLRKLPGWLMTLQTSRMHPRIAAKILIYQNECDDVLWTYWWSGHPVNPRLESAENPTQIQVLLKTVQLMAEVEQRLLVEEEARKMLTGRVEVIEKRADDALQDLVALPAPAVPAPEMGARSEINKLLRSYCHYNRADHAKTWRQLYSEFTYTYHVDLSARARNQDCGPLDVAEALGLLPHLYSVAYKLLGPIEAGQNLDSLSPT